MIAIQNKNLLHYCLGQTLLVGWVVSRSLEIEKCRFWTVKLIQFLICNAGCLDTPKNTCRSLTASQFYVLHFWYIWVYEIQSDYSCHCTSSHLN